MDLHLQTLRDAAIDPLSNMQANLQTLFTDVISVHNANLDQPLVFLSMTNPTYVQSDYLYSISVDSLRLVEKQESSLQYTYNNVNYNLFAVVDIRSVKQSEAILGICRTIFVSIVLTLGSMYFSKDINDLALRPIERMIRKVNQIASNPLSSKEQEIVKTQG